MTEATSASSLLDFRFDSSFAGTGSFAGNDVAIDFSGLSILNALIGLEFNLFLSIGDSSFDSVFNISNVHLNSASSTVPTAPTVILLLLGLGLWTSLKNILYKI